MNPKKKKGAKSLHLESEEREEGNATSGMPWYPPHGGPPSIAS